MSVAQAFSATERGSSRGRLLRSLALNLFFVGVAIAMAVRAPAPSYWDRNVFVRVERLAAALPPARRAYLLRAMYAHPAPSRRRYPSRRDQRQPRRDRRCTGFVPRGAGSHSSGPAAGTVRRRSTACCHDENPGGTPGLRPIHSGGFRRDSGENLASRTPSPGRLAPRAESRCRQIVVLSTSESLFGRFKKVVGMQGAGNAKEAGTKARGRPFWTMLQGLSLTLPLAGCLLTGDKPEPGLDIPPAYSAGPRNPVAAEAAIPPLDWWRSFRSRELTELIEEARSSNLDIAVAVAQIVQADAQARIAGAALLPIIDFNANGQHSQQSKTTGS